MEHMTKQIIFGSVLTLSVIYTIIGIYVWHFKLIPIVRESNHKIVVNFWSLTTKRGKLVRAFMDSYANETDKPWFHYYIKSQWVAELVIVAGWVVVFNLGFI
jgi:hypothetical protein